MNLTNSIYKRGKDIEVYTGYDKAQAIDELGKYLSNTNSMYQALVKPITSGKMAKDIQIKMVASQIRFNMKWEADANNGIIKVVGKSKYYPIGEWETTKSSNGNITEILTLDLHGKDADLLEKDYLDKRVANFLNMAHEVNLLNNLKKLGVNARGSNDYEDRVKKVDIIIRNGKESMGVSVYKSDDKTALDKLKPSNAKEYSFRYAYNILKYGRPSNIKNVKSWRDDCNKGLNRIIFKEDGTKYITK